MLAAVSFVLCISGGQRVDATPVVSPRPSIGLPDLSGKQIVVFPSSARKGVVVFFALSGCPNAQGYAPEMNRIAKTYGPRGWRFYLVFVDTLFNSDELKKNAKDFGYAFPVLHGQGKLLSAAKATMSPETAVFAPTGSLLYHGRIDDRFYALGKQRLRTQKHDLRNALDAIDAGKPVSQPKTDVIGCVIPKD